MVGVDHIERNMHTPPNTACSGQQGVGALFKQFSDLGRFPFPSLVHAHPAATNASRWAAVLQREIF
jgi:hypothetical protein